MPRKKRASIVDTLLSVKGVARLLRNIKLQDPLGTDTTVASGSNSIEEWSSTDRRSRRTSESPGRKHRHQRGGTRPKSHHPGTWPESPEPRDFEDVFQDDKSEYWDYEDDTSLEYPSSDRHGHTSRAVLESDSRYALFQDSRNDFAEPSTGSQSTHRTRTTVQSPTQRAARSVASSSRSAAKLESLRNHRGHRHKVMREDTDLESSDSERSATGQKTSQSRQKDDDRFIHESVPASAAETTNTKKGPLKNYDSNSDDNEHPTKTAHDGRSSIRQFTKQLPRRQVRFVKSNAHLRGLVNDKLPPPKYEKFEAHYQKILAQKQNQGSSASEKSEFRSPKTSSGAHPMSSQSAVAQLLTAPSLPTSPVSAESRAPSQATAPKSKAGSEVSVSARLPSALRTNTSTTAGTISSAWASTASSPTVSRAPSYTSTRAPSHTASREPSRASSRASSLTVSKAPSHIAFRAPCRTDSSVHSRTTSRAPEAQQGGHYSFIATSAASSEKPKPSARKSTLKPPDSAKSPHPDSTKAASMYKSPANEKHPHKQYNPQVNEEPSELAGEHADEHVDEQLGQHADKQANEQGSKQRGHQAKFFKSTSRETTLGGHETVPDVASNGNSEVRSNQCHLQGLLPEVYDCKYKTRHCYACSRPRDMRYVEFRNRFLRGEEPQRSLCRTCRRCLERNEEFSLVPYSTNKRTLKDIKGFHWCAQCGTIRSHKFHEHYPSGIDVPPRHQLCHPCCNFAKLPPKNMSSTYKPRKPGDDASNDSKKRAGGDQKSETGKPLHRRQDIGSASENGPAVATSLSSNIPAEEAHPTKSSTRVISPGPGHQHHPSKSHATSETSAAQTGAERLSQAQTPRPAVDSTSVKYESFGGLGGFNAESWKIPADDSPPPQCKRFTTHSNGGQSDEGLFYEDIHVNYHEILRQNRNKHHRNRYDVSLPEIWLTSPTEEAHITQPTVILEEQCPGRSLHDNLPRFSVNDCPARDRSKYQRQPSMQSEASNLTVRPLDNDFSSCRNKENYPDYPPQYTTPRQFHWPTEREEVDENQPKGLSDMFYETDEGKCTDAWFASMSSWSEPKRNAKSQVESTDNYKTWPPGSYDTTERAAHEYLGKRRSIRQSVIPGSPPHSHVRKASDSLSVETVALWQGVTPGAPTAEVTEPESPAGEEFLPKFAAPEPLGPRAREPLGTITEEPSSKRTREPLKIGAWERRHGPYFAKRTGRFW